MSTTEERLAGMEAKVEMMQDDLADMRADLKKISKIADMGSGALWFVMKAGFFIVGAAGFVKLIYDFFHK